MAKILNENLEFGTSVLAISAGEIFFVLREGFVPRAVEKLAEINTTKDGNTSLLFAENSLLVCRDLHFKLFTAKAVFFARHDRRPEEGIGLRWGNLPLRFPRLRKELTAWNKPWSYVPGGFQQSLVYPDEMAILDDRDHEDDAMVKRGWVVSRLNAMTLLDDVIGYEVSDARRYSTTRSYQRAA